MEVTYELMCKLVSDRGRHQFFFPKKYTTINYCFLEGLSNSVIGTYYGLVNEITLILNS